MKYKLPFCILFFFLILTLAYPAAGAIDKENASSMIVANGIKLATINAGDDMVNDGGLTEEGNINIFEAVTKPTDIYNDPDIRKSNEATIPIFKKGALILLLVLALICLYQIIFPTSAAEMSTHLNNGRQTYYQPKDILSYAANIAFWFIAGPGTFLFFIWSCDHILSKIDTSVLSQVVISSENVSSYVVFGACSKLVKYYMAIRNYIITYADISWYIIGFVFAWKKIRWVGVLCMTYTAVQIYSQIVLVLILVVSVNSIYNGNMSWASDMLSLGAMTIILVIYCFFALFFPVIIDKLKPGSIKRAVSYVRYLI